MHACNRCPHKQHTIDILDICAAVQITGHRNSKQNMIAVSRTGKEVVVIEVAMATLLGWILTV